MTRSQKFIAENKRALVCGPDYFNPDTELMPLAEFSKAKIKCLFIFPTPSDVKAVSTTKEALNDYVRTHCPDVFVDFAYIPNQSDAKLYEKYNMPLAIGNITHLDPSHFDVVGFSISILSEVVSTPAMMYSFRKCDTPILTTWSERKDLSVNKTPIFFAGGITASCGDIMFGDLGDGRQSFLDFLYLGECDKEKVVFDALLEAKQKDLTVQEYIDTLFVNDFIYQPQAYEVKFNDKNQIISNKKINPKAQDFVRPYIPYELNDDLGIGRSIINANGDGVGVSQVQVSLGCSGGSACNFCHEGNYCGPWIEKTHDLYVSQARESKKYSAAYKHKPYSFNCNYVTDYKGLLYKLMQLFPKVTFINMRLEELGRDVDALKIMKLIGSNRISAPMEGISPRIQNNLFNKCLSEESLNNFMMDMVHARLTDLKCGLIFSGYEEDEDYQWICDFVDSFKKKASKELGNFPFRAKATPLVHYQLTPCEYLERRSAKKSMLGEHWLTDEWYEKFREHQVFFKVNGFRYSTFLEQSIIDLGRSATKWMWDNIIKQDIIAYSLRSFAKEEIVNELKKLINVDHFFEARDPDHYISLSHRIHIDLMGSYIARARALVRAYKNGNIFDNVPDVRCLKTYEGAKVKCYKSCVKEEPLKIYNDVEMDEQGNLHGEYRELSGCERCKTPDMRKWRLTRSLPETRSSNDIIAFKKLAKAQKVRFVIKRLPEYDVLSPNNTAHTVIAKVLQQSEELLDMYHSIEGHNNFWQCDPDQPYYTSGIQIIDTVWTSTKAIDLIKPLVSNVNSILKTTQILSVQSLFVDEKLRIEDYNVFRFESTLPMELFQTSSLSYKGDIRVKKGEVSELIRDPKLNAPVFISKGKVIGYFVLPLRYNPFSYLQGLMQDKKISTAKLLQTTIISTEMVVRETANICKVCGQESGISSLTTGKQLNFGIKCLPKVLLSRITK
nr:MAG TPA: SAM superfamily protein [Caudoviricetes sp.]